MFYLSLLKAAALGVVEGVTEFYLYHQQVISSLSINGFVFPNHSMRLSMLSYRWELFWQW